MESAVAQTGSRRSSRGAFFRLRSPFDPFTRLLIDCPSVSLPFHFILFRHSTHMGSICSAHSNRIVVYRKFRSLRHHDHRHDTSSFICVCTFSLCSSASLHDMISFLQISWSIFYYLSLSFELVLFVFLIVVSFHLSSISSVLMVLCLAALASLTHLHRCFFYASCTPSVGGVCLYDVAVVVT